MAQIISVRNWERFQHYKDRDPPWVKLYRDLLTTESWVLGTDSSRLVQIASILLAARYGNQIPMRYDLLKKVASLEMTERTFFQAVEHLQQTNFLDIQSLPTEQKPLAQSASTTLATCTSEAEQSRGRAEAEQSRDLSASPTEAVDRVFGHWKQIHDHPRAHLDAKRRKTILAALKSYSEADLCEAISGYRNSPHHQGANERSTVYDDIELMLRDAKHIEAGLGFSRTPPQNLSQLTRRNVTAIEDWVPPEQRTHHAAV